VQVVPRQQVVDCIVDARDQIERASPRQRAHVRDDDMGALRSSASRLGDHLRRDVASSDGVAPFGHWYETLPRAASDVEQASPTQPVVACPSLEPRQPGKMVVAAREAVVERR
jgi:hypothetical protein